MQWLEFELYVDFLVAHPMVVVIALVILLALMAAINQWRERRLVKQMASFLSPQHQDILTDILIQSPQKPLSQPRRQTSNPTQIPQALDADFLALKRALEARNQARKKD